MISLLIRLFAVAAALWAGKQIVKRVTSTLRSRHGVHQHDDHREIDDEMVKDPVCQTFMPKSLAIQQEIRGIRYYFCSRECASIFLEQEQSQP